MDEASFERWLAPRMEAAVAEAENTPPAPEGSATGRFFTNAWEQVNPVAAVKGLYHAVTNPLDTAYTVAADMGEQWKQAGADVASGARRLMNAPSNLQQANGARVDFSAALGHALAGSIPLLGPAAARAGEQIGSGDVAGGLGAGTGQVVAAFAPQTVARGAQHTGAALQRGGRRLIASDLKPAAAEVRRLSSSTGEHMSLLNKTDELTRVVAEKKLRTGKDAERLIGETQREIDSRISRADEPTVDVSVEPPIFGEPQRTSSPYSHIKKELDDLRTSVGRQAMPEADLETLMKMEADLYRQRPELGPSYADAVNPLNIREVMDIAQGTGFWRHPAAHAHGAGNVIGDAFSEAVEKAARNYAKAETAATGNPTADLFRDQNFALAARKALEQLELQKARQKSSLFPSIMLAAPTAVATFLGTGNPIATIAATGGAGAIPKLLQHSQTVGSGIRLNSAGRRLGAAGGFMSGDGFATSANLTRALLIEALRQSDADQ